MGMCVAQKIRSPRTFYFLERKSLRSHSSHAVNCGDFWLTLLRKDRKLGTNNKLSRTISGDLTESQILISKDKENFILTSELYSEKALLVAPLFSNLLLSETLYDKEGKIKDNLSSLFSRLKEKYSKSQILNLVKFGLDKASEEYKKSFENRLSTPSNS